LDVSNIDRAYLLIQWIDDIIFIDMKNLASIDLNLLTAFDALMREQHVSRAAARIGLAQPSMSNALSRLRLLFDDELFVRKPSGMRPTPRAEEIGHHVVAALEAVGRAVNADRAFDPASTRFTVRLAASDYVEYVLLPVMIPRLRELSPGCSLHVTPFDRDQIARQLDNGDIDLAIGRTGAVPKRHCSTMLFHEDFVCIARAGHPSIAATLDLDRFLLLPHALVSKRGDGVGVVDAVLAESGRKRQVALSTASFVGLPFLVSTTDLVAVIPRRLAEQARKVAEIRIYPVPVDVGGFDLNMIWDRGTDAASTHRWFRRLLSETFRTPARVNPTGP
jgi:DNA-binding transcriptional LysR family regulator